MLQIFFNLFRISEAFDFEIDFILSSEQIKLDLFMDYLVETVFYSFKSIDIIQIDGVSVTAVQ